MPKRDHLPLVYSCSGCSSAAQLANHLAIRLDRSGRAEMSCIAGVGGDVPSLVRTATSGRPIVAIDGCHLRCVQGCLARHGLAPSLHYELTGLGVKKRFGADFEPEQAAEVLERLTGEVEALARPPAAGTSVSFKAGVGATGADTAGIGRR
jgi:uncharacterized metal-binding protein